MPDETAPDESVLDAVRPILVSTLRERGVQEVRYVGSLSGPCGIAVWLCAESDAQRDNIGFDDPLLAQVRATLLHAGLPADWVAGVRTTAQSQETVDRDFHGSWFYATR
jgi:hypothetical protein